MITNNSKNKRIDVKWSVRNLGWHTLFIPMQFLLIRLIIACKHDL